MHEFSFSASGLVTPTYLRLGQLEKTGPDTADEFGPILADLGAVAPSQTIEASGDVDVFAMTMVEGAIYTFDVDSLPGTAGRRIDLQIDIVDAEGRLVATMDDNGLATPGTPGYFDPLLDFRAPETGTYFVAVHSFGNEYLDGQFRFEADSGSTGPYALTVRASGYQLPCAAPRQLGDGADARTYTDAAENVRAGGGGDRIDLRGGDDVGSGGWGRDSLIGGQGHDELGGEKGDDTLDGGKGDDVLLGGEGNDRLLGGDHEDDLMGGTGADLLDGGLRDDVLWGEGGGDDLSGGDGRDVLRGGGGIDALRGGAGADTFHYLAGEAPSVAGPGEETILDFDASDLIDLSDLAAGRLAFLGDDPFTGEGQVRVFDRRSASGLGFQEVQVNLDADVRTIELSLYVDTTGSLALGQGDFLL